MQVILTDANTSILRFDNGEDIMERLLTYAEEHTINGAVFSIIGATKEITIAYYNLQEKKYQDKTFTEDMEIVSVTGNIGRMDGKPIIHAHGVFSDSDYQTHGGHLKKLVVSATGEVTLTSLRGELNRSFDETTGLNLLK